VALIPAHRRYLGAIALAVLVLLMLGALVPDPVGEWHPFRVAPGRPDLGARLDALSRAVREYVEDNFGYARSLPYLRGTVEYSLRTPSDPQVYFGQRRHLFYSGENAVSQATGSLYRVAQVRHFVAVVDALRRAQAPADNRVVVLLPPSAQSIPMRDQPTWWRIGGPLEYDLAISELRAHGFTTIDLKAAFNASPELDLLYRHTDSHWRWNGALIAFNMAMRAIGHDEWSLDPATTLAPLATVPGGDLAHLLGLQDQLSDTDYALRTTPQADVWTAIDVLRAPPPPNTAWAIPYAFERASAGERLLVLGDSFTMEFWRSLLLHTGAARIGWMHFANCTFDFEDVARFQPTHVIVAPTERLIPCKLSSWPRGLPRDAAVASR
jgi:alginate O-acetyltransferase complex protein AlgJ